MALNFKTLGVRALSALFFVAALLACLLWNYVSFTLFFFAVAMIGLNEFYKLSEKMKAAPYRLSGFLIGALVYLSFTHYVQTNSFLSGVSPAMFMVMPFLILSASLFSKREHAFKNALFTIGGILYAVLPFGLLHDLVWDPNQTVVPVYYPYTLLGIILLIWSNDTFAYLGGSLLGKHKMIERISPGKTWEGTLVGLLLTIGSGYVIGHYILEEEPGRWILFGALVPVFATIGDLIESMLKREAQVKDSGNIMPGHGGILDRFDSLIFVTPFVFLVTEVLLS